MSNEEFETESEAALALMPKAHRQSAALRSLAWRVLTRDNPAYRVTP